MPALIEYKCPFCDGAVRFDPQAQKCKCPYCESEFEPEKMRQDTGEAGGFSASNATDGAMNEYVCGSCGGEIITEKTTVATSCPYCGNPVIMKGGLSDEWTPDTVIPFQLDKDAAKAAYRRHLQGKRLLPKVFADENHIDEIKGLYVPFWLYSSEVDASIRYDATKERTWSDGNYRYHRTEHYSVVRSGRLCFENLPVDGSEKMPNELMESVEPFDLGASVPFSTAYLAGYMADKYDVDKDDCAGRAKERMKHSAENIFNATVTGYSGYSTQSEQIGYADMDAKYALLPVWLLNTSWNGKKYLFAMNAQTGKMVGDLPVSMSAFWKWYALFAVLFALAASLLALCFDSSYVLPAFLIGALLGFIPVLVMKSKLKSVRRRNEAGEYFIRESLVFTERSDHFLFENTTRTAINRDNKR